MIEFAPTLGEDALIGRAPVRPRGRSSSSSINNHSISSKQQRSSSITNSPDPSIITSDAAEPTASAAYTAAGNLSCDCAPLPGVYSLNHLLCSALSERFHLGFILKFLLEKRFFFPLRGLGVGSNRAGRSRSERRKILFFELISRKKKFTRKTIRN